MWKGDNISKNPLHRWIARRKLKPKFCERCNKIEPYELANISGKYFRDVNDFIWLCRNCHSKEHRGNKEWHEKISCFRGYRNG